MKKQVLGLLACAGMLSIFGASCEQPQIDCRSARGSFATVYVSRGGGAECSDLGTGITGLQSYYVAAGTADDPKPGYEKSFLAMRAEDMGNLEATYDEVAAECAGADPVSARDLSGKGDFAGVEPTNDYCSVAAVATTHFASAAIPAAGPPDPMDPENPCLADADLLPAIDVKYTWSNVQLEVTSDVQGTRFQADLKYEKDGCSADYTVCGVWPVIGCEKLVLNEETGEVEGTGEPEDKLCDPDPDPEVPYQLSYGSGINSNFGAKCDPTTLLCVLPTCPFK